MKLRSLVAITGATAAGAMLTFMPATAQAGSGATGGTSSASTVTKSAPTIAVKAPGNCDSGHICFYTQKAYKGSVCKWDVADPDTTSGAISCSWMSKGTKVKSVYNNGSSSDGSTGAAYYAKTNYKNRIGCTKNKAGGNVSGTWTPRSVKWVSNKCG